MIQAQEIEDLQEKKENSNGIDEREALRKLAAKRGTVTFESTKAINTGTNSSVQMYIAQPIDIIQHFNLADNGFFSHKF